MQKVYIVKKNADFTEGRGPMRFHSAWSNGGAAIAFVESQPGIYGSQQYIEYNKYGLYAAANGYDIEEVPLHDVLADLEEFQNESLKQQALKKLTGEERKALGL